MRAELEAAAGALKRPAWRVLVDAVKAYVGSGPTLSDEERRAVRVVLRLHEKLAARPSHGRLLFDRGCFRYAPAALEAPHDTVHRVGHSVGARI